MRKHWYGHSRIYPMVASTDADQAYKLSHAPQFQNAEQYIQAKLIMLQKDFYINPTKTEIKHLYELTTESEINRAVRQIINNHWR